MNRILYISPGCFDKGGISRYNRYQIRCIQELYGVDNVRVISLLGQGKNSIEDPFQTYWHGGKSLFWSKIGFICIIFHSILFWRPKIVVNAHVNFSSFVVLFCSIFKCKSVLNVYGSEIWSGLNHNIRRGLIKSDYIISDCHNTADYVKSNYRQDNRISVIWDCVDLDKFYFDNSRFTYLQKKYNLPLRDEHFIVLTLGRMSPETDYKGYSRLIRVLGKSIDRGMNVKLIMAGSGGLVGELKRNAEKLGVSSHVTFTGSVDENDLAALYAYGHIFSLVTESGVDKGEGIPLTPLEAMACGTPIIVGNQDGSREAVFEPINGYVIDPMDLDLHTDIICRIYENPELRKELSENAQSVAREYFSFDLFKAKHATFLAGILNQ